MQIQCLLVHSICSTHYCSPCILTVLLFVQGPEKTLLYAIEDGRDATDYFTIDPITGVITVETRVSEDTTRPADYVVCAQYRFMAMSDENISFVW